MRTETVDYIEYPMTMNIVYAAAHPHCANGGKKHYKHQNEAHTHMTIVITIIIGVTVYSIKGEHLPFQVMTLIRIFDSFVDR